MVSLRVVTESDWPLWREARLAALADAPHAFTARLEDWPRGGAEQWRARLALPGSRNVVAVLDGRAVGMIRGVPRGGGACELRSVWVGRAARGRGVGGRLLAAVETWARESGATSLRLSVLPGNAEAIAFYRRNGFLPTGRRLPPGATGEQSMAKRLG
ncbi:GNAT family N-acetyltransferase [Streptomyces sp. MP131-18]|uniref:GNAT family N-acetyltransferase n=1 Tax=Streptomyces sp. MP131-18 TaxID=1857892 RepID=UPI00097BC90D|nr:GNAT family N-acetyltransferase [Streptomyces sp. MP131-18]